MNRRSFVNKLLGLAVMTPAAPAIVEEIMTTPSPIPIQPPGWRPINPPVENMSVLIARDIRECMEEVGLARATALKNARHALEDAFRPNFERMFCNKIVEEGHVDLYKERV
jgi:hypothetical protein